MKIKQTRIEYIIIITTVIIKTFLHLIADSNSGFDGDEVLYIDAGKHLSLGYMEAPPMIGLLAFVQNMFHSVSLYVHHIFVHLASAATIVICGLITIKLEGKWRAVLLTMFCIAFAPAFGITHNSFQPVIFDQFFWILCIYYLVLYCRERQSKYLILLGIVAALGFLTKYSMIFFLGGLVISVIIWQPTLLKKNVLWISVLMFIIIVSPNIYWQVQHGMPVFDHFTALYKLIENETAIENVKMFFLTLNPIAAPVWFAGIFLIIFSKEFKEYRLLSYSLLFSFLLLILAKGRFYYFFPIALAAFSMGSVFVEIQFMRRKWILTSYIMIVLLTGLFLIPFSLPVIPLNEYVKLTGLKKNEDGRIPLRFEARYTKIDWKRLIDAVYLTYQELSPEEKENCLILGSDYTQPGVVNLFGEKYGLPEAISFHSSYYTWIPEFTKDKTIIAIGNTHLIEEYEKWVSTYKQFFETVELKSQVFCPYARDDRNATFHVYVCKGLKYDSKELKEIFKNRIFE